MRYLFIVILIHFISHSFSMHGSSHFKSNVSISGLQPGCKHSTDYFLHSHAQVKMCTGVTDQDLKNGMTIIKLIESRGYLPTCRVMQLMLWMASEVAVDHHGNHMQGHIQRDTFVDIGANIGSCSVHMAALGFPVVAVEPVHEHVNTILGSVALNPSFHLDIFRMGIAATEKSARVTFGHGFRNWGATNLIDAESNDTTATELQMITTDHLIGHRRVALMKIDCEGCEADALKGAKRSLKRIPMIKMELVQPEYVSGNETMNADMVIEYLNHHNFDVYIDHWNEQNLYFGKHGNILMEIDQMFGSKKFQLPSNLTVLNECARKILANPINVTTFHHRHFLKKATDIIAIEKSLSERMKRHWLIK